MQIYCRKEQFTEVNEENYCQFRKSFMPISESIA